MGTFEVKHGVRVNVANLYSDEVGNPKLAGKLQAIRKHRAHVHWAEVAIGLVVLGAILGGAFFISRRPGQSAAVAEKSIAVLPFENLSSDKDQGYFSDGISEDLLNLLTKVPQLQVTARTSSFSFKGKEITIPEIARRLHVAHILEGSVQKAGNEVRITAQLVDAATDTQRWSQTWDRKLDDIFKIQDEIANAVVEQLKVTLLNAAPTAAPTDPQAYALYLRPSSSEGNSPQRRSSSPTRSTARRWRSIRATPRRGSGWPSTSTTKRTRACCPSRKGTLRLARRR